MKTVKDFYDLIDGFAPFDTQCDFDNSGLLCGDFSNEVKKVGVCLDITPETVNSAYKMGVNLIISHHPVIFHPVKSLSFDSAVALLAKYNINAVCAHTNLDKASGGVNDRLCEKIGLKNVKIISCDGLLRMGELEIAQTAKEFCETGIKKLNGYGARYVDAGKPIKKVAVCSGAGGDFAVEAFENGADALFSGDVKYNEFLKALELGISLIDCGHYATENVVVKPLCEFLSSSVAEVETVIIKTEDPLKYSVAEI